MRFREFVDWCYRRFASPGMDRDTISYCFGIILSVIEQPFWKRERMWRMYNIDGYVEKELIAPIEEKIRERNGGADNG